MALSGDGPGFGNLCAKIGGNLRFGWLSPLHDQSNILQHDRNDAIPVRGSWVG